MVLEKRNREKDLLHIYAAFTKPKLMKDNNYHIIASIFITISNIKIDVEYLMNRLNIINMRKLVYINISDNNFSEKIAKTYELSYDRSITMIRMDYNAFGSPESIRKLIIENKGLNSFIFHFEQKKWSEILMFFRQYNIIVSGGSNTKRHVLSPVQLRLAFFLMGLNGDMLDNIIKSFDLAEENKPILDLTSKYINDIIIKTPLIIEEKDRISEAERIAKERQSKKIENEEKNKIEPSEQGIEYYYGGGYDEDEMNKNKEIKNVGLDDVDKNNKSQQGDGHSLNNHRNNNNIKGSGQESGVTSFSNQKREYHTSLIIFNKKYVSSSLPSFIDDTNSTNILNNKSFNTIPTNKNENENENETEISSSNKKISYVLSYLDSIEQIVNNSNNPIEAQSLIENLWINIIEEKLNERNFLTNRYSHRLIKIIKEANTTLNLLYQNKYIKKRFPLLEKDLNKIELLMLTYSLLITYHNKLKYTALSSSVGNLLIYEVYKRRRNKALRSFYLKKNENKIDDEIENNQGGKKEIMNINESCHSYNSFSEFIKFLNFDYKDIIKLGDFFISIFTQFPHNLFQRDFDISSYYTHEGVSLSLNHEYINDIKENIIVHPSSLPMVCTPNLWSKTSYGGYLENKNQKVGIITGPSIHKHNIENKEILYDAINYLNHIKFGVNKLLLNYLDNEGQFLLNEIDIKDSLQKEITLKIARSFSNIPFYLTTNADWRGRIYTQSFFITYQGGDLASALLNFWDGEVLTESGKYYLYIYGSNNHNEKNIGKASYSERIKWVNDNYDRIINLDRDLILSAENKFVFTAFCLNMRELHYNPNTIIKTPIFLDATCSGIQHLAALLQDLELGSKVSLVPYKEEDKPGDIYSELVVVINEAINKYGRENINFVNLSLIKLNRNILKQSILTKVYNVTRFGIAEQLKSKLNKIDVDKVDNKDIAFQVESKIKSKLKRKSNYYIAPGINMKDVYLTSSDIMKIAEIINEQIFVLFPSMNYIYTYFIDITKLMIKLNIAMSWFTPAGLKITQHYLKSKQSNIAYKLFGKTKKIVLKEWTDELNKQKQTQAIIPNIIHSLDATHLINLLIRASTEGFGPIITIHDCFGTLPNKMGELEHKVKKEFILLYSQKSFLKSFHERIIQSIRDNQFTIINNSDGEAIQVLFNDKLIDIPKLPKLGKLDIEKIIECKYMIT
jgi:hypothetical protein